jgi:hypothetical protein
MTTTGADLSTLLHQDHATAKTLLQGFEAVPVSERQRAFDDIVGELVRHEVAEEEVLYPTLRDKAANGNAIADARIAEQAKAEQLLSDMEHDPVNETAFMAKFHQLRTAVLAHAEAEESTALPALVASVTPDQLRQLGERYEAAKKLAPTHPHPNAPDAPPGNLMLGPVAALFDRARDAVRGVRSR